ncbi:MAG TPA: rubredoxin [Methanoregulaceae archaeon]|nr:rubredoxin [Methanoregulaceae archaeon]
MVQQDAAKRFVCTVCGHTYDPRDGDARREIPPGTSFASLPDDWVCPVCSAGKKLFREL